MYAKLDVGPKLRPLSGPSASPIDLAPNAGGALLPEWKITKANDMAKQHYIHRYNVKLDDAEQKKFEEYYLSYISNESNSDNKDADMGRDGSERKIPRKKSDALRHLIDIGLLMVDSPVEVGNPRKVNVDSLLMTDIREEIRRIGVNINQLAKVMNSIACKSERVSESTERKMSKSLQMGVDHMNDILKRLLDSIDVMDNKGNTDNIGNSVVW